jgi:hypothetical protein
MSILKILKFLDIGLIILPDPGHFQKRNSEPMNILQPSNRMANEKGRARITEYAEYL